MKKDIYKKPLSEIEKFSAVDVITTSGENVTESITDEEGWINKWY